MNPVIDKLVDRGELGCNCGNFPFELCDDCNKYVATHDLTNQKSQDYENGNKAGY